MATSPQIRIGSQFTTLTRQCHGKVSVDKTGKATCRETYEIGYEYALAKGPGLGSPHPIFKTLIATSVEIEETEGNMASIPVVYEGLYQIPVTLYERDTESTEVPIETHPDFATWVNSTNAPTTLPIWTPLNAPPSKQKFGGWAHGSPFEGQEKYLVPKVTFTATTVSSNRSGGGEPVGLIDAPGGPVPVLIGSENWLLFSVTETDEGGGLSAVGGAGGCFRYKQTWHASGQGRPWNPAVYSPSVDTGSDPFPSGNIGDVL
jgi:hypothetical protein